MKATNSVTKVTVSGDEATLRRLDRVWVIEDDKKAAPRKQASSRKSSAKSDDK